MCAILKIGTMIITVLCYRLLKSRQLETVMSAHLVCLVQCLEKSITQRFAK